MAPMRWLSSGLVGIALAVIATAPTPVRAQDTIRWEASIESAKRTAAQSNRLVLVIFTAPQWCVACRALESDLNSQSSVGQAIETNYVAVRIDADYYPNTRKQYNVKTLPTTIVLAPTEKGEVLDVIPQRLPLDQYLSRLNRVADDTRRRRGAMAQLAVANNIPPGIPPGIPPAVNRPSPSAGVPNPATANLNSPPPVYAPAGLDGYCPVRLVENSVWTPGQRAWSVVHGGRSYFFAGETERRRFLANPERYAPVLSGSDVVMQIELGHNVQGMREHGAQYGGHVYLFADEATLARFTANPKFYAERALEATRTNLPQTGPVR